MTNLWVKDEGTPPGRQFIDKLQNIVKILPHKVILTANKCFKDAVDTWHWVGLEPGCCIYWICKQYSIFNVLEIVMYMQLLRRKVDQIQYIPDGCIPMAKVNTSGMLNAHCNEGLYTSWLKNELELVHCIISHGSSDPMA